MRPFSRSAKQASLFCSRLFKWLLYASVAVPATVATVVQRGQKKQADFSCVNARKAVYRRGRPARKITRKIKGETTSLVGERLRERERV